MQNRLREEIRTVCRKRNEPELTAATFESMPYLNAVIKVRLQLPLISLSRSISVQETLRMRPIVYNLQKQATRDEVIPLLKPVLGEGDIPIREIPVKKGQRIWLSVVAYNRWVGPGRRSRLHDKRMHSQA